MEVTSGQIAHLNRNSARATKPSRHQRMGCVLMRNDVLSEPARAQASFAKKAEPVPPALMGRSSQCRHSDVIMVYDLGLAWHLYRGRHSSHSSDQMGDARSFAVRWVDGEQQQKGGSVLQRQPPLSRHREFHAGCVGWIEGLEHFAPGVICVPATSCKARGCVTCDAQDHRAQKKALHPILPSRVHQLRPAV